MEKNNQIFSTKSVYGSCAVTSIIVIALWAITHNWIVLIAALIAVPYLVTRLFHKEVNKRAKGPIVIMIILAILLSFMFLRFKDEEPAPVEQPTVIVDEQTDDEQTQDETDSAEQQESSNSNSGSGGYRGGSNFDPSEKLTPNYSNVGGNSNGSNVNVGNATSTAGDKNHIQSSDDNRKEQNEEIQNEVNNGKDKVDLEDGITGVVDNRPQEEEPNDAPQVDIDKDNAQDSINEGEDKTPPAPLPDEDQLKEDAEESDDTELDDMFEQTKPTDGKEEEDSDKTETTQKPEEGKDDDEDVKPSEKPDDGNKEEANTPTQKPEEDNNKEDDTTKPSDDNTSEETTPVEPVKTPVTITALDGNEAIAGDTVQFKVTGDVKTVEGLDGLDYSIANGYLSVNTQDGIATVISPVIIGADGTSTATASVTVNVLNFD